jgi:AbrB family looped-hinge helix DNA binding protein
MHKYSSRRTGVEAFSLLDKVAYSGRVGCIYRNRRPEDGTRLKNAYRSRLLLAGALFLAPAVRALPLLTDDAAAIRESSGGLLAWLGLGRRHWLAYVDRPALASKNSQSRILTTLGETMRITSKGQVTIPIEIREQLGLLPHTEVRFEVEGNAVRLVREVSPGGRGRKLVDRMRGRATSGMSTEEIMALTRGEN